MFMVIVGILSWWYTAGWRQAFMSVWTRFVSTFDYFSIDLLIKTLFSPYRQISAGKVDGPIGMQLRAFVDKMLSRVIGAILRTIVMVIGIVTLFILSVVSAVYLLIWAIVPALPVLGLVLMLTGWIPWRL